MPTFKITSANGTFQVTAPDHDSAYSAFLQYQAGIPPGPSVGADTGPPTAAPVPGFKPGQAPAADQLAGLQANWGKTNSGVAPPAQVDPWAAANAVIDPVNAFTSSFVNSIPVAGPALSGVGDKVDAAFGRMVGAQQQTPEAIAALHAQEQQQNPAASAVGSVAGTMAPLVAASAIPGVAGVLGMDATAVPSVLGRAALSAGSMGTISGADALTRGESPAQAGASAVLGGLTGAVAPPLGEILGRGVNAVGSKIGSIIQGATDPAAAANNAIARAAGSDLAAGQGVTALDEANAALNGQPLVNADRFGGQVRALARATGNLSPNAADTLKDVTQQRFQTQNQRAVDWINRVTGGNTNSFAAQQASDASARAANAPAYKAAYADSNAQAIMTPRLGELLQAPLVRKAITASVSTGANDSALHGFPPVQNPFRFNADGSYQLTKQTDGSIATPTLQFWDQVQRNLGTSAKMAAQTGNGYKAAQSWQLRQQINNVLDNAVPAFQQARQGAAAHFGADDALEAGQNFINTPVSGMPAAQQAFGKFSPAEKKMFANGFASSLVDKVSKAPDSTNVVNNVFASPQARAQIQLALGAKGAAQLEPFLRVENIMQQTKNAVQGNSSTAAQQAAMAAVAGYGGGVASGGGFNPLNWNANTWKNAGGVAALTGAGRAGAKFLGAKINDQVMQNIASTLASRDPAAINQIVQNAAHSPQALGAIKAIERGMQLLSQGAGALPRMLPAPGDTAPAAPAPAFAGQ